MSFFSSFFIALLVSMLLVPLLMRYADVLGLVDVPDARKMHIETVPRSGGIAIICGFLCALFLVWPFDRLLLAVVSASMVIVVFGFLDDRKDLDYRWKFFGQIVASCIAVAAGLRIEVWPFLGIEPVSALLSIPVTIIFLIGVTNAMNLSDGLDGLAAGASLITLGAIAWLFWSSGSDLMATICLAIIGAVCGFLRYNNHPAVVFMGDTGSQFLGFMTGCLAIILCQKTNTAYNPALFVLLVGLPILDTISVMLWRVRTGKSPFHPDKNHFHHRLLEFGLRHYEAVSAIYLAQAALVITAVMIRYQGDWAVISIYLVFAAAVVLFFRLARAKQWRFRASSPEGILQERRNNWLRSIPGLSGFMERVTELMASAFLIFGAIYSKHVAEQVGWIAAAIAALALLAGLLPGRLRKRIFRAIVFISGAVAVYSMLGEPRFGFVESWFLNAYMIVLAFCLIFAIRLTRREHFQTSPLDVLIICFVIVVVVATTMKGRGTESAMLADTAIRLAVFFYVGEYLSSRQAGDQADQEGASTRLLPVAAMGAMTILAARGLM